MAKDLKKSAVTGDTIREELRQIRNLLIILLMKFGVTSSELDIALKMGPSNIRTRFPATKVRKITGLP